MKEKRGEGGKGYENRWFSTSGISVPPNPFSRALCSTSDPDSEAPSTRLRNSGRPLVVGLTPQTVLGVPTTRPFPSVSAGDTPDVPAMGTEEEVLRVWNRIPTLMEKKQRQNMFMKKCQERRNF
jgi:hypothetical protein